MATFGKTTVGASWTPPQPANISLAARYYLPEAGVVTQLFIYARNQGASSQVMKLAIWNEVNSAPSAPQGTSSVVTLAAGAAAGWYSGTLTTGTLSGGWYWLGANMGSTGNMITLAYDVVATTEARYTSNTPGDPYSTGPGNPFPSPRTSDEGLSVYAVYTVQGADKLIVTPASAISAPPASTVPITAQYATSADVPVARANASISWTSTGTGGFLSPSLSTTDALGKASTTLTTSSTLGTVHTVTGTEQTALGKGLACLAISSGKMDAMTNAQLARYDLIVCNPWDYARISPTKALNANVKFLTYKNGLGAISSVGPEGLISAGVSKTEADANTSWYLRKTTDNSIIQFADFPDKYLMDMSHSGYQTAWRTNVLADLNAKGFDGVFVDDVNDRQGGHYGGTIKDPANTAVTLTQARYAALSRAFMTAVYANFVSAGKLFVPNFSNSLPPSTWNDWITLVDGSSREFWTKFGDSTAFARFVDPDWSYDHQFLTNTDAAGKLFIPITYVESGSSAAITAVKRYARASFLLDWLGSGRSAFAVNIQAAVDNYDEEWGVYVGTPTGAKYNVDGVATAWRRDFTSGTVIVNAGSGSKMFALGANYTRQDGSTASSVTLASATGEVLRRI